MEIRPFRDDDVGAAAELLAERHRRHRRLEPFLPERYERVDEARAVLEGAWRKRGAGGVVATQYSTMVTDWRVPNLLVSRFWPRRGFRTTFLRLYRSIP